MFRPTMNAIIDELNTGLCLRDIANHWACRCTVPGPGMRKAAEILRRRYLENGAAEAEVIGYPADDRTEFLDGRRNPLEWRPRDARLEVISPATAAGAICRYADEPLCLVCNSTGTPPEGVEAQVVAHGGPLGEGDVAAGELAGKLLLTDQPPSAVQAAARKAGALGVISDCVSPPWLAQHPPVREPEDAPDLVMWTIFSGTRDAGPLFGFNLSARQGRRLRALLAQATAPVVLRAFVDAELVEGASELVHAVLPGSDLGHEEVWVLAHLSEPGARDNASGCCLSLELARTLATLTASGTLPPLRRTIRFMHAEEVRGFLPYIDAHRDRLRNVVAGLCLDSVGQDFTICGGELVLFRSPEQDASFIDGLLEALLSAVAAEPIARFCADNYAGFPWHTEPFWGNDAFISDGFFDIPTPQLSTWPDRHYHSSEDTPDQMSPNTLGRVGAVTGAFLHLLATAGAAEARWFGQLAAWDWKRRICRAAADEITAGLAEGATSERADRLRSLIRHMGLQGHDAVVQAGRFAPGEETLAADLETLAGGVVEFAGREGDHAARALAPGSPVSAAPADDTETEGARLVARRLRWGAPPAAALSQAGRERLEALAGPPDDRADLSRIWRWINGYRTAADIRERLRHGGALPLETVVEYLRVMAAEGFVEEIG